MLSFFSQNKLTSNHPPINFKTPQHHTFKMQKAKKYDWKDSNMALFGSDTEKEVNVYLFIICVCLVKKMLKVYSKFYIISKISNIVLFTCSKVLDKK